MYINVVADNCVFVGQWDRIADDICAEVDRYPAANVGDAMERFGLMNSVIAARTDRAHVTGTALTILTREGDNLAIHRALDDAQRGDVLVINGGGDTGRAVFGDLLAEICLARGIAGVVIDGAVRDVAAISALGLPVWARAVTPAGPTKTGPGRIGLPIACGGIVVESGDLIVGDTDGVAVVPASQVLDVLSRLEQIERVEADFRTRVHLDRDAVAAGRREEMRT